MALSSLAELVRTWRERALLTQEQLARHTGLGVRTIRRLEADGLRRPRTESLRLLADALKLTDEERARLIAAARVEPDAQGVPRQLPADVTGFAGRARQLRRLDALLDSEHGARGALATVVISAIAGTAGVGKTALAVHWSHRVADRFPDGQLYVNLRGFDPSGAPIEPTTALRGFLDALGVPPRRVPQDVAAQAALYRSRLAGKRVLVLLDNARDAEQVRPLLPGSSSSVAVVTSRHRLTGLVATEGARPLVLDLMSTVEARELLAGRLGADRVAADAAAVEAIIASCARLPLALAVVAARAAIQPDLTLAELAAGTRGSRDRLDAFDTGDAATDVRAVFSWSYHRLSGDAARLFRLLGLHPGPDISAPAAASLAGVPTAQVRPLLAELVRAHLLTEPAPDRYALHDLLRSYAAGRVHDEEPAEQRRAAVDRVLDHYLHTAAAADRLLTRQPDQITLSPPQPGTGPERLADHPAALAWLAAEHDVLLAAVAHAAGTGRDRHTWQLAWSLANYLDRHGRWRDLAATQQAALDAAGRDAGPAIRARSHRGLARAHAQLGRPDDADRHLRAARDLYGEADDRVGLAHTHYDIAMVRGRQGDHAAALDHARQALDLFRAAGHRDGQANALNTVGWFHSTVGNHRQALAYCRQALALLQELGNPDGQAATWDSLGYAYRQLGEHAEAVACFEQALHLYRDLGDRYTEADVLIHLGDAHRAAGHPAAARDRWHHALAILDDLDHPDADEVRARLADLSEPDAVRPGSG